jgi:hypothetical protein
MNQAGQFGGSSENEQNGNSPGAGNGGNNGNNTNGSDLHNDDPELLKQQIIKALPQNMLTKSGNNNFTDLLQMLSQQHTQNYNTMETPPMCRVFYQGLSNMVGNPSAMMRVIPEYGLGSNNITSQGLGDYNQQSPLTGMHNVQQMPMMNANTNTNWTPDELTKLNECLAK